MTTLYHWGRRRCQRRVQIRLLSHPRTKRWKIIRADAASPWGFQKKPAVRTTVREGRHRHSLCIHKALRLLSLVAMLLKGREVSKARLKGAVWYFWGASLSPDIIEEVGSHLCGVRLEHIGSSAGSLPAVQRVWGCSVCTVRKTLRAWQSRES